MPVLVFRKLPYLHWEVLSCQHGSSYLSIAHILHRFQILKEQEEHYAHASVCENNSQSDNFLIQGELIEELYLIWLASCSKEKHRLTFLHFRVKLTFILGKHAPRNKKRAWFLSLTLSIEWFGYKLGHWLIELGEAALTGVELKIILVIFAALVLTD